VAVVVGVEEVEDAAVVVDDVVWCGEVGVGGPELHATTSTGAATVVANANCRCRPRLPRIGASMACNGRTLRTG
jgi:hypothetical protein